MEWVLVDQFLHHQQLMEIINEAIYSLGGGGLTVEYTLPFIKNIGVSVGAILGAGSMSLELYQQ